MNYQIVKITQDPKCPENHVDPLGTISREHPILNDAYLSLMDFVSRVYSKCECAADLKIQS